MFSDRDGFLIFAGAMKCSEFTKKFSLLSLGAGRLVEWFDLCLNEDRNWNLRDEPEWAGRGEADGTEREKSEEEPDEGSHFP